MKLFVNHISSLYKIRSVSDIPLHCETEASLFRGEHFAFQTVVRADCSAYCRFDVKILDENGAENEALRNALQLYRIKNAAMDFPIYADHDSDIITDAPGLMPDILESLEDSGNMLRASAAPASVLYSFDIPRDMTPGCYSVVTRIEYFDLGNAGEVFSETHTFTLRISHVLLPESSVHFSQWFHVDSIAELHGVPIYSEAHWTLIDKYMKAARYLGIDTILTPIFTPPLDTLIGGERPKVQLVRITKQGENYTFDFSLAARFIDMALCNSMRRFEISHLYSQWGLVSAPNIYVTENGSETLMFGWHTDAQSKVYSDFLRQFIPALIAFLKEKDVFDKAFFHLSDEPSKQHPENYKASWELVKPMLQGRPIIDAISDVEFYKNGWIDIPVSATSAIEPFLRDKIENQWAYYCCGQHIDVGNRFLCFPAYRNRILGTQIYKFGIKGFLQWGFNFYHSDRSVYVIDPYITTSCDGAFPSGDPFSVYPGKDGPLLSLRALVFKDALQDVELLKLLEEKTSRAHVIDLIDELAGMDVQFNNYPRNYDYIPTLMARVRSEISGE